MSQVDLSVLCCSNLYDKEIELSQIESKMNRAIKIVILRLDFFISLNLIRLTQFELIWLFELL